MIRFPLVYFGLSSICLLLFISCNVGNPSALNKEQAEKVDISQGRINEFKLPKLVRSMKTLGLQITFSTWILW